MSVLSLSSNRINWTASAVKDASALAEKIVRMEITASENSGRRDVGEPIAIVISRCRVASTWTKKALAKKRCDEAVIRK